MIFDTNMQRDATKMARAIRNLGNVVSYYGYIYI